jgi:hypothetical protein
MRTGHLAGLRGLIRALCFALSVLVAGAVAVTPAVASTLPPEYSLSIVEGANTQPEDSILNVSGYVHPKAEIVISIAHNGLVVEQDKGDEGAWLAQVPQIGDVIKLESPAGVVRGAVVYDGLPSLDPTVCAGSTNFSGQRSAGETVEGGYYTVTVGRHHHFYSSEHTLAQVQVLSGPNFQGSFLTPLLGGETVFAVESLTSPIAGGTFTYSSENDRPVGACPVPPPPPPPPPPLALMGSIVKLVQTSIHRLLQSGWSMRVAINQPGRIVEDLYLHEGALPAFAAGKHAASARTLKGTPQGAQASKRHRHKPPALLLARGTETAKAAGTFKVTMHLTAGGRRVLGHARTAKVVLIATLRANSGAKLTLGRRSLTLHR